MPKVVKYQMGGRAYPITEKVSGISERWRKHLRETPLFLTFQSLDGVVERVVHIIEQGVENLDAGSVISLARLLPALVNSLSTSMDDIKALVYDYVPEMQDDADWIAENVYDEEIVGAFIEVLKLIFPIMGILDTMRGAKVPGTATNLPSTNGATGTKKSTARSKIR